MLETMKAEIASTGTGLQVKGSCRGFELTFDEPKESGGTDTPVNPVEGLLCAFGACQAIATLLFARMQDVPLDGVRVEVEGDLDPDGFTGKAPDVRNGLQEVRFSMHLKSSDEAAARALAALVEERCPVSDCLKAPVPVVCAEVVVE